MGVMGLRLKEINIAGFKTFPDPASLNLLSNLVAIVGPNGCGKSNVIDAVRWVLGETSVKNLRSQSMSDVIFNGSTGRKAVGQASVELVFENADGAIGGRYASYSEISVRRQASRDNQSDYFINNTRCRKRDIVEIFIGTGLGPRSYAIIGQGTVSQIVEAKPAELRGFVEEAAGISLYRKRRQETEARMAHTRENLARLEDIQSEIEKQLDRLKRQAESAGRYTRYKQEHDQVEAELLTLRWRSLDHNLQARSALIQTQAAVLEEKIAGRARVDCDVEQLRETHIAASDACHKIQARYYELAAQIARIEQTLESARERQQQLQVDLMHLEQAKQGLDIQLESDSERWQVLSEDLARLEPEYLAITEKVDQSQSVFQQAEETLQRWVEGFEAFQRQAEAPQRIAEVEKARIEQLEKQSREADAQLKRLQQEGSQLEASLGVQDIPMLEQALLEREQAIEAHQQAEAVLQASLKAQTIHDDEVVLALDEARGRRHALQGRLMSLEALQQAALGNTDACVVAWLEMTHLIDNPRVGQQLKVTPGFEWMVETVFGSAIEAICVADIADIIEKLPELSQGNLMFFDKGTLDEDGDRTVRDRQNAEKNSDHTGAPLVSEVNTILPIHDLCAGIYVMDNVSQALNARQHLSPNESIVTRDGFWCGAHWLRVYRGSEGQSGVLGRETEITELKDTLVHLDQVIAERVAQQETSRARRVELEREREALSKAGQQETQQVKQLTTQLSVERARLEHIQNRLSRIQNDSMEHQQKLSMAQEDTALARLKLETALDTMGDFSDRRVALEQERDQLRALVQQSSTETRNREAEAHQLALKKQVLESQKMATIESMNRLKQHILTTEERRLSIQNALEESLEPQTELRETLEARLAERLKEEKILNEARASLDQLEQKLRYLEKQRAHFEQEAEEMRTHLEQTKMEWQALEVRRQTVQDRITELGVSMEPILATLPEAAHESTWIEKLEHIASRIQKLGAINLAAIEEYQAEQERKNYLDAQHLDLTSALETLADAIRKIDRETRIRFKETFEKLNAEFQQLFPRLFGGGHAYLELTGEDLLEAGVSVMARPPGKRNSSIYLLSGGEKALTAIAMVFAIFQLNPAPFCMLDEVDAPLDDTNVGRFSQLLEQMSSTVQFIYVTHNKIAMEMAKHLVGVTMKEPGVSRLVSVDVLETVDLIASA